MRADGPLLPAEEPLYPTGDVHEADDPERSLRYASDFAPWKPRTDLLLVGACHPPGGTPQKACRVELRVGTFAKALAVIGDRRFSSGIEPISAPTPFRELALGWERAFGGPSEPRNPVGRGADSSPGAPLPNVELPQALMQKPDDRPPPAGFGPLAPMWQPRFGRVGTYDAAWLSRRWPGLPRDFDYGFYNAAPADQQVPYLRGDETLSLTNLHPAAAHLRAQLPGMRARAFVHHRRVGFQEVSMQLDTLWIDTEAEVVVLVWRGLYELTGDSWKDEVEHLLIGLERIGVAEDASHWADRLRARIAEDAGEGGEASPEQPPGPAVGGLNAPSASASASASAKPGDAVSTADEPDLDAPVAQLFAQLGIDPDAAVNPRTVPPSPPDPALLAQLGLTDLMADLEPQPEPPPAPELPEPPAEPPPADRARFVERWQNGERFAGEDLSGIDLSGLDLRGIDLSDAILAGARLDGAQLDGARLEGASAAGACFVRARLRDARLSGADLAGAQLSGAELSGADLSRASLVDCRLDGARLEGANLTRAEMTGADLSGADARGGIFVGAELSGARLDQADFSDARMTDIVLERASGERAQFTGADLAGARATGARLAGSSFREARAARSVWTGAQLEQADFRFADLERADFTGAALAGAQLGAARAPHGCFARASLRRATLLGANLFRASLEDADLREANCQGASCFEAELGGAKTDGASFRGANLARTKLG